MSRITTHNTTKKKDQRLIMENTDFRNEIELNGFAPLTIGTINTTLFPIGDIKPMFLIF